MSLSRLIGAAAWLAVFPALSAGASATTPPEARAQILRADVAPSAEVGADDAGARTVAQHAGAGRIDAGEAGLPGPASWVLMVIGVGMIGGALRGFVVASRRLARLQPEELD
jgi:hypothetical protein